MMTFRSTLFLICALLVPSLILPVGPLAAPALAQRQPSARAQERIQKEVRHQLLMLPYFGVFDNLTYKVDGYNVILGGAVTNPTLKSDAERSVQRIEGVEKVANHIEVLPVSPMDDGLRRQLYRAIYGYPSLQRYALPPVKPIRILVKNGHVALEGVVDSQSDKSVAGIRASGVAGVFSVKNNLLVAK
jgi:osmotically-inducible protein OsmY